MSMRLVRLVALSRHPLLRRRPMLRDVLVHLADLADDDGRCWPSAAYLRETVGLSRSYVFDAIASLEHGGLLAVDGSRRGRRGQIPVRRINCTALAKGPTLSDPIEAKGPMLSDGGGPMLSDGGGPMLSDGGGSESIGPGSIQDDPVRDPSSGKPPPPTPHAQHGAEEGESFFARVQRTAAAVVERYVADEDRPFDEVMMASSRAKLVAAVAAQLQVATDNASLRARAQDILRAWELLRDDGWWRSQPEEKRRGCVRLAWLVGDAERIEARFERAAEVPQWQPNGEITQ